jgi:hypothetical protein
MLFFILTVAIIIGVAVYVTKKAYQTDHSIPTIPPSTIHDEIAKTVEEIIKTQDPIAIEAPFVAEKVEETKPKKKAAPKKKEAPKMKPTPKKKKTNA